MRLQKNEELRQKRPFIYFIMNKIINGELRDQNNEE